VVYVSFGSLSKYSKHQMDEIVGGLQQCGRPYLLIVRGATLRCRLPPRSRIRPSDPPDFQRRRVRQINLYPTAAAAAASYAALIPRFMILLAWFLYSRRWIQHGHGWIRVPSLHRGCRRLLRRPCTRRHLAGGHCVLCIPVVRHIGFRRPSATAGKVSRNMSCHRGC